MDDEEKELYMEELTALNEEVKAREQRKGKLKEAKKAVEASPVKSRESVVPVVSEEAQRELALLLAEDSSDSDLSVYDDDADYSGDEDYDGWCCLQSSEYVRSCTHTVILV